MNRSYLFYAANVVPELCRVEESIRMGYADRADRFIAQTLRTIDLVLAADDISLAGKEEWSAVRNLVASYRYNDPPTNRILLSYGSPFSQRFARGR